MLWTDSCTRHNDIVNMRANLKWLLTVTSLNSLIENRCNCYRRQNQHESSFEVTWFLSSASFLPISDDQPSCVSFIVTQKRFKTRMLHIQS